MKILPFCLLATTFLQVNCRIKLGSSCFESSDCKDRQICQNQTCVLLEQNPSLKVKSTPIYGSPIKSTSQIRLFDKCMLMRCSSDHTCKDGSCIKNSCLSCSSNQKCGQNGQCIKPLFQTSTALKIDLKICSNKKFQKITCGGVRPNDKNCPVTYYFRAPDPSYCGIRKDGSRVNFAEQCSACKDKNIQFYFKQPCHSAPFICGPNQQCNGQYCHNKKCLTNDQCPYNWQSCIGGLCIDSCATRRCRDCKYGKCAYQQPIGECSIGGKSSCKQDYWSCVGFKCVDQCLKTSCAKGLKCNQKTGGCEKNIDV